MTKRGVLLAAIILLAVIWLSERADKIISEEEGAAVIVQETPPSLPLSGEEEEVIKPDTSPYEGEVPAELAGGEVESAVSEAYLVASVIDGDTIKLANSQVVRYIGIDTPETRACFAQQATEKNRQLVEGQRVRLEKDVSDKDKYGRLLRYVYINDVFVNDVLVRQGYANAYQWPPDVKYRDQLRSAQNEAKTAKKGLWGGCG